MENLPNELLSEILGFVHPVYDRLIKLSTVCHRWNEIIHKTPSLWEHFHLKLVQLTKKEKSITFRCLREYNAFIKCLRVPALHVVFGYDYWFFIRIVTLEMTNITCLDVPTLPWNLQQFVALKSAENLKELNLYCFWDLSDIEWTQSYSQPVSLINQGHFQLLKVRYSKLEVLKLSMNMLRMPGKVLIDFLNALKLKDLQICAYNSSEVNIQMNQSGLKLLKCLLSSRHVLIVSKLDLQCLSIGHKELRLLLKVLKSLRFLKLRFLDIYRCMTGYQYLESSSLEYFELENLPAKNIVNLKCAMPKLRRLVLTGCSSLRCLQVLSSMLQQLFLNYLPNLRSLHVTATTLKLLVVGNCEALTSETIDKVLQSNKKIENCTVRGHLTNFKLSRAETNCVLTELRLWITDICQVQRIEVHCPTLKSFMCNHHDPDGDFLFPVEEASIDLRCNDLVDAFITLPRITSINIKCKTITHFLLNVGKQKLDMRCSVIRIEGGKKLKTFSAHKCIFNRVEVNAEEIDNLDFNKCRIKGVLKVEGGCIDVICMRNLEESQVNVDMIARCYEIRNLILRECSSLHSFAVFSDEQQLCQSSLIPSANPCFVREPKREDNCSNMKSLVKTICTSNCPCFSGLLIPQTMKKCSTEASASSDESSCKELRNCEENSEDPKTEACLGLRNAKSSSVLDDCEKYEVDRNHYYTMGENTPQGSYHGKFEEKDPSGECVRFSPLTTQSSEGHSRHASGNDIMPIDEQSMNKDTLSNGVPNCEHQLNTKLSYDESTEYADEVGIN